MNAHRLELVARDLDSDPPFNFAVFVDPTWGGDHTLGCGTPACALGRAATIPELRQAGLTLYRSSNSDHNFSVGVILSSDIIDDNAVNVIAESKRAACQVFDLSSEEYEWLFTPAEDDSELDIGMMPADATAAEVAKHIRSFIVARGIPSYH